LRDAFLAIMWGCATAAGCLHSPRLPTTVKHPSIGAQLGRPPCLWFVLNANLVQRDLRVPAIRVSCRSGYAIWTLNRGIVLSQVVLDLGNLPHGSAWQPRWRRQLARRRVAIAAMWLAATCPFVATIHRGLTESSRRFWQTAALVAFAFGLNCEIDKSSFTTFIHDGRV